jgi:hypothetical protein
MLPRAALESSPSLDAKIQAARTGDPQAAMSSEDLTPQPRFGDWAATAPRGGAALRFFPVQYSLAIHAQIALDSLMLRG